MLRGNHENDQMIARPFKMGGGFTEECLSKYNHRVLAAFQRMSGPGLLSTRERVMVMVLGFSPLGLIPLDWA